MCRECRRVTESRTVGQTDILRRHSPRYAQHRAVKTHSLKQELSYRKQDALSITLNTGDFILVNVNLAVYTASGATVMTGHVIAPYLIHHHSALFEPLLLYCDDNCRNHCLCTHPVSFDRPAQTDPLDSGVTSRGTACVRVHEIRHHRNVYVNIIN